MKDIPSVQGMNNRQISLERVPLHQIGELCFRMMIATQKFQAVPMGPTEHLCAVLPVLLNHEASTDWEARQSASGFSCPKIQQTLHSLSIFSTDAMFEDDMQAKTGL